MDEHPWLFRCRVLVDSVGYVFLGSMEGSYCDNMKPLRANRDVSLAVVTPPSCYSSVTWVQTFKTTTAVPGIMLLPSFGLFGTRRFHGHGASGATMLVEIDYYVYRRIISVVIDWKVCAFRWFLFLVEQARVWCRPQVCCRHGSEFVARESHGVSRHYRYSAREVQQAQEAQFVNRVMPKPGDVRLWTPPSWELKVKFMGRSRVAPGRLDTSGGLLSTVMNLETHGSTAQTLNLGIGKQRRYRPMPASWASPVKLLTRGRSR